MTSTGPTLIQVIKELRALTGLGLAEAKRMVDDAPSVVAKDLSADQAAAYAARLEAAGAQVELRKP